MIVEFHGMKCRCSTYDFTEPQYGLWCHFLTEEEMML